MKFPRFFLAMLGLPAVALVLPAAVQAAVIPSVDLHFSVEHLDRATAPGADFAKYAWGGWAARTEIPSDKASWGSGSILGENNWARIRKILEESAANPGAAGTNQQKVGDFFAAATDEAAIEAVGIKPLQSELARIDALANLSDLALYLADAHRHNSAGFFGIFPYADQRNSDVMQLIVGQGGLSLPTRDY